MKEKFPGFFPLKETVVESIWRQGTFSLDSGVLLDLYRYSDETRAELLRVFDRLGGRLWIAHRAAEEFLRNRLNVIAQQVQSYDDTISDFQRAENDLRARRGHPFVDDRWLKKLSRTLTGLKKELQSRKSRLEALAENDVILEEIARVSKGKIGNAYDPNELEKIYQQGEVRFKSHIPPGFRDSNKKPEIERYGDLLIWFQLIDYAKSSHKPIIFVTGDAKEDWWLKHKSKNLGPRPELIAEIRRETKVYFVMYSLDQFLAKARQTLDKTIAVEAIAEVKKSSPPERPPTTVLHDAMRQKKLADIARILTETSVQPPPALLELLREQDEVAESARRAAAKPVLEELRRQLAWEEKMRRTTAPLLDQLKREEELKDKMRQAAESLAEHLEREKR